MKYTKECIDGSGFICPRCGSNEIDGDKIERMGYNPKRTGIAASFAECNACGKRYTVWFDICRIVSLPAHPYTVFTCLHMGH